MSRFLGCVDSPQDKEEVGSISRVLSEACRRSAVNRCCAASFLAHRDMWLPAARHANSNSAWTYAPINLVTFWVLDLGLVLHNHHPALHLLHKISTPQFSFQFYLTSLVQQDQPIFIMPAKQATRDRSWGTRYDTLKLSSPPSSPPAQRVDTSTATSTLHSPSLSHAQDDAPVVSVVTPTKPERTSHDGSVFVGR